MSVIYARIVTPSGSINVELNLVLVCPSYSGFITLMLMAATNEERMSEIS